MQIKRLRGRKANQFCKPLATKMLVKRFRVRQTRQIKTSGKRTIQADKPIQAVKQLRLLRRLYQSGLIWARSFFVNAIRPK